MLHFLNDYHLFTIQISFILTNEERCFYWLLWFFFFFLQNCSLQRSKRRKPLFISTNPFKRKQGLGNMQILSINNTVNWFWFIVNPLFFSHLHYLPLSPQVELYWTDWSLLSLLEVWQHLVTWPGREKPGDLLDPFLVRL